MRLTDEELAFLRSALEALRKTPPVRSRKRGVRADTSAVDYRDWRRSLHVGEELYARCRLKSAGLL